MPLPTKRTLLRAVHLIIPIPILGYVYGPPADVQQYAGAVRFFFVPILLLTGYWMYAGLLFALLGAALFLAAAYFASYPVALLTQLLLFIARKLWLTFRTRRTTTASISPTQRP